MYPLNFAFTSTKCEHGEINEARLQIDMIYDSMKSTNELKYYLHFEAGVEGKSHLLFRNQPADRWCGKCWNA